MSTRHLYAKLPPPLFILLKTATKKNFFIFFLSSLGPLFVIYLSPSLLIDFSITSFIFYIIFLSLSIYICLKSSGFLSVLRLYRKIYIRENIYDLTGYMVILPIFTLIPKHIDGGVDLNHIFIFKENYNQFLNYRKEEIVSNGFKIFNANDPNYFNPLIIAQPFSEKTVKDIPDGELVRFLGNKKFGFIFTKNNIIWLKGSNVIYK